MLSHGLQDAVSQLVLCLQQLQVHDLSCLGHEHEQHGAASMTRVCMTWTRRSGCSEIVKMHQ